MYVSSMCLVLCHVSGRTDLVTPINSVLFCSVHDQYNGGAKVTACFHNTEQIHVLHTFY